jgi:hypothetical protein
MAALKWEGFVLLESMFSMAIIMTSFTICMMTFNSMTESQRNYLALKAQTAIDAEAARCKDGQLWLDADIPGLEFNMERRVRPDESNPDASILEIKAIAHDGKMIAEYYEFVYTR